MLIDVETDSGVFLAKVFDECEFFYMVKYLVYKKNGVYDYEDSFEKVDKDCVCGVYDPGSTEADAGFAPREAGGFTRVDDDEGDNYEPSDEPSDEDDSDDESLEDEDEDES